MAKPRAIHTIESLLSRTVEEGECLMWTGYHGNNVPQVCHEGGMKMVRRVILELQGRKLKPSDHIATTCGCQSCVNPKHIAHRSRAQHMAAMNKTSRRHSASRSATMTSISRATKAKINLDIAREIRLREETGPILAQEYGISRSLVNRIKRGTAWKDHASPFAGLIR